VEEVQQEARDRGYTIHGEMFSVDNMAELARSVTDRQVTVEMSSILMNIEWLVDIFSSGKLLLIPYDCGHNHGPAKSGGKKAHWALITGIVVATDNLDENCAKEFVEKIPEESDKIFIIKKTTAVSHIKTLCKSKCSSIFLIGRQSKSVVLGIWNVQEMVDSNENLKNIDSNREEDFVIPEGGVEAGLLGRMVVLH